MNLKINFQETVNVGNNVMTKGEEFKALLARIKTVNNNLKEAWQGGDAEKYSNAVEEQTMYMDKLASAIDEAGAFLVKVGKTYQEAMEVNSSAIR